VIEELLTHRDDQEYDRQAQRAMCGKTKKFCLPSTLFPFFSKIKARARMLLYLSTSVSIDKMSGNYSSCNDMCTQKELKKLTLTTIGYLFFLGNLREAFTHMLEIANNIFYSFQIFIKH
jgi:hypothetical protein